MSSYFKFKLPTIILAATMVLFACSKDEDKNPSKEEAAAGTITFSLPSGVTATATSPAVVTQGQPLDMEISQKSSYTDPNGSVYTCEPKASIKLDVKQDTLYAKDLQTLISITESSDVSESGTNPRRCQTLQKFNVGGQEVVFDLAHEIYTYVNSNQASIEMPYIKVNSAKYGAATPKETRSSTPASVSGIRLKRLGAVTRGTTVTTSQAYEVNVSFNLELEGVNTKQATTQTLSFETNYVGIVETVTELPNPTTSFSYKLEVLDGTSNTTSPFTLQTGKTLSLQWKEDSRYSYFALETLEEKTVPFEPKAWVKLVASADTIWTDKKETLEKVTPSEPVVSTEGNNPTVATGKWVCDIGGQTLTLDYGYEAYDDVTVQDTTFAMPYLELGLPEIKSVTLKYLDGVTIPGVDGDVYEVTARITQELKTVNAPTQSSETLEYVVKYIGVEKIKLVKVTYRKQVEWESPHDNIHLNHRAFVYRDRTYSNGVTITDTFIDLGQFGAWRMELPHIFYEGGESECEDGKIIYTPPTWDEDKVADSAKVQRVMVGVPDITKVKKEPIEDEGFWSPPGNWKESYAPISNEYDQLNIPLDNVEVVGADSISSQPSAWYSYAIQANTRLIYIYDKITVGVVCINSNLVLYDQYLVIDGQMIWFKDGVGPYEYSWEEEDTTLEDGTPAKVITFTSWITYWGKQLSGTTIVTVYQRKDAPLSAPATPAVAATPQSRQFSPLKSAKPAARQKSIAPKGDYRFGFISGGDIHGRGKGPRPFTAADDLRSIVKRQGVQVEIK